MTNFLKFFLTITIILTIVFFILFIIVLNYARDPFGKLFFGTLTNMNIPPYPNSSSWASNANSSAEAEIGPTKTSGQRIEFTTDDSAEQVTSFYENELTSKGWKITDEVNGYKKQGNYPIVYSTEFSKEIFIFGKLRIIVKACDPIVPTEKNLDKTRIYYVTDFCKRKSIELGG